MKKEIRGTVSRFLSEFWWGCVLQVADVCVCRTLGHTSQYDTKS